MLRENLWKLVLSVLIAGWAVSQLIPVKDVPFPEYARTHVGAKPEEFDRLLDEAVVRAKAGQAQSAWAALRQIATEGKIDLTQYFPDVRIESTLRNLDKRNQILMDELLRRSKGRLQLGLDLQGGDLVTLEVDPRAASQISDTQRTEQLSKAIEIISARVDAFGVAEPIIRAVGNNRIAIELPGKDNPDLLDNIKRPAKLEFRRVYPVLPGSSPGMETPPGYEPMTLDEEVNGQEVTQDYYIKRIPDATGSIIKNAFPATDSFGRDEIVMNFTSEGRKEFAAITREIAAEGQRTGHLGQLAIVLDGKLCEAPTVREEIDSSQAEITGSFTQREAMDIADVLNNPLDLPLIVEEQYVVGPSLAQDAIDSGVRATVIGTAAVAGFMIVFYTSGGLVAVGTLAVNMLIILGVMASFGATMTLPGLAGIVLTIGMAVDANILIFERIREEVAEGKKLAVANQSGYRKALSTIIDAHIVQLIICSIMIWLGTGAVKGFGVTLAIGVLSTMFTVLITGHLVTELLIYYGWIKRLKMRHLLRHLEVDFVKFGRPAFIASWLLVLLGLSVVVYKGNRIYGIDFSGGDEIQLQYKSPIDIAHIRSVAAARGVPDINPTYESSLGGQGQLLKIDVPEGKADTVLDALERAYPGAGLVKIGQSHIGASVGREIELNALLAVGVSMMTILVYIAFRFEFGFGVGAMFSTLHDILMTIGIFVLTGHQFSGPMVAAILCIAGYSINETVVVFDRIREELKLDPNSSLRDVVNTAITKVFARTIMTATTTFLAALSLFLFGSGVLRDISFTFLVGICTSTFSAICIAAQVFYWWHKGDRKHMEAHADVTPKYEWTGSSKASR